MSDIHDEKLESMLQSRRLEPAAADLAERIILRAQGIAQNQPVYLRQWVRQLCAEFHLPRPAYTLTGALLLGLLLGFSASANLMTPGDANLVSLQSFLYPNEGPL